MTAAEVVEQLKGLGTDAYKRVLRRHGIPEPLFGVKIEELKKFQKRIKQDYRLALDLYDTGIYDAMYLAGLIADAGRMTEADLRHWLDRATCAALRTYTVAWVAAESRHGRALACEWIDAADKGAAEAGWATLGSLVSVTDDADLDVAELKRLLRRVQTTIHRQPDRVRYVMNGFVIAAGCYVRALTDLALRAAEKIGPVAVDMGETACTVPSAAAYTRKVQDRGALGKKRKTARC
jgi:DNA alkylation repair enzyme